MLDAFIIEQIQRRERKSEHIQPALEQPGRFPLEPMPAPREARSSLARSYTCASQPAERSRMAASSPPSEPPTTMAREGRRSSSNASLEVMASSRPGISGTVGHEPVATRMCFAVYVLPPTSTECGDARRARPLPATGGRLVAPGARRGQPDWHPACTQHAAP